MLNYLNTAALILAQLLCLVEGLMKSIFNKKVSLFVAVSFAVIGALLIIFSLFIPAFNNWSFDRSNIDPVLAGNYGGFIGGVAGALFGLVSAILLFLNFHSQEKSSARQQLEARFFEMIRLHRDNVLEMHHQVPYYEYEYYEEGRRVFLSMHKQFREIYKICSTVVGNQCSKEAVADIAYMFFFFGTSIESKKMIIPYLDKYKEVDGIYSLFDRLTQLKATYSEDIVKHGGHQSRLGHYYRHLYQAVRYIHDNKDLTDIEKYGYIRMLRSQLSTTEQAIFFYNSISQLGKDWRENGYVSEYQFIKNLPPNFVAPLEPKDYYPEIVFEYEGAG